MEAPTVAHTTCIKPGSSCGRLLLHACCGPCSLEPTRLLRAEGWDITICYVNPNIAPADEYAHRLTTLCTWAAGEGIEVVEGTYDPASWEREVAPLGSKRNARCEACYRLRLHEAAQMAAEGGYDALATTLAVSPYQLLDACNRQLVREAGLHGVRALPRDFRAFYPQATKRSRELGMYRQNYCGCRFSAYEAAMERTGAREDRRLAREVARVSRRAAS